MHKLLKYKLSISKCSGRPPVNLEPFNSFPSQLFSCDCISQEGCGAAHSPDFKKQPIQLFASPAT